MTQVSPVRPPVVVLGLTAAALTITRSLARLGVEVHGVYANPMSEIARHSRFLAARYRVTDPDSDDELLRLLAHIRRRISGTSKPILIATIDRYARLLVSHRSALEDAFVFHTASTDLVEAFLDKRSLIELCRRYDLPIPRSCAPDGVEDIEEAAQDFRFPVIIKPARAEDHGFPGKNVVVANAPELLGFYRSRPELIRRSMFQEVVPSGDGYNVTVAAYSDRHGRVLALCTGRKLRQWLPDVGINCFGVSETLPELQARMTRFLDDIGFVGFAGIEFAQHVRSGELYFLELNPRVVYDNQQWADAGVDLSAIGYREMCGDAPDHVPAQRDGIYWIDLHRDIPSFVVKWFHGQISVVDWLRSVRRATSYACYDPSDPKPFVASIVRMFVQGLGLMPGDQVWSPASFIRLLGRDG